MSSSRAERRHAARLQSLLAKSGLVCQRAGEPISPEEVEEEKQDEEIGEEEEEEVVVEEQAPEEVFVTEESVPEEQPSIFPSPSLRRLIPDRKRAIEAHNRIRVIPKKFNGDINPNLIPKIRATAPKVYIDVLAQLTGCSLYKHNMAEFWFLDTLANLLRRAQEDKLDRPTQAILILWFCEWMKEMQEFDAASRTRMLRRWKENMINAIRFVCKQNFLPTPAAAGVHYEGEASHKAAQARDSDGSPSPSAFGSKYIAFEDPVYECSVADLITISHYLYDLFSTDYQYNLVRMIFTFGPDYHLINGPYQIENPKKSYIPQKPKPRKETKKVEKDKGKKVIPDTEEYVRLMELKNRDLDLLWEQECYENEEYSKRHSILPLNMGFVEELFNLYFPPASEDEIVEMAPLPVPAGAGAGAGAGAAKDKKK